MPAVALDDVPDVRARNAELTSDGSILAVARSRETTYLRDVGLRELGVWIGLAGDVAPVPVVVWPGTGDRDVAAPLRAHVREVVLIGPEEQMIWADAPAIIAVVEDAEPIGDWSDLQFPRKAVCRNSDPVAVTGKAKHPVAVPESGCPFPAAVAAAHLRPEPISPFHSKEYTSCR